MKIKFVKGKHKGEIREVSPQMAEFFCKIRQEAIILKVDDPKIQTQKQERLPDIPKARKG
jgi:acid phosphatase class B